jgi:hypothetical protein
VLILLFTQQYKIKVASGLISVLHNTTSGRYRGSCRGRKSIHIYQLNDEVNNALGYFSSMGVAPLSTGTNLTLLNTFVFWDVTQRSVGWLRADI